MASILLLQVVVCLINGKDWNNNLKKKINRVSSRLQSIEKEGAFIETISTKYVTFNEAYL